MKNHSPCLEHDLYNDTFGVNVSGHVTDDYDVDWNSCGNIYFSIIDMTPT